MVVDASVFVAATVGHEISHQQSRAMLRVIMLRKITVHGPSLLPIEVAGSVARNTRNASFGHETLRAIETARFLKIHPLDLSLSHKAGQLAVSQFLRGADAVYVALAAQLELPLVTLDIEMLERSGPTVQALTPQGWLLANPG